MAGVLRCCIQFSHRGVAARLLQRVGTLTTVYAAACYFFLYFFHRIFIENFVAALCSYRCRRSKHSQLFLLGEFFGQQKRPHVRPLLCFQVMRWLIPVSIFPLFILKRVAERWSLCDAVTFDFVSDYWLGFFLVFHMVDYLV